MSNRMQTQDSLESPGSPVDLEDVAGVCVSVLRLLASDLKSDKWRLTLICASM